MRFGSVILLCGVLSMGSLSAQEMTIDVFKQQWEQSSEKEGNAAALVQLSASALNKPILQFLLEQDPDRLEDLVDDGVDDYPESAQLWYLRGRVHAILATSSVFSALSHASDSLESFEKAAQLEPSEIVYQNGLFGFYQNAPGIAGGSIEKAIKVAEHIKTLDEREGYRALISIALDNEEGDAEALIAEASKALGPVPEIPYMQGIALQEQESYDLATAAFKTAIATELEDETSEVYKLRALYQLGRNAVLANSYSSDAQQALETYLSEEWGEDAGLPEKNWARLRLAQILMLNKDIEQAKGLIAQIDPQDDERLVKAVKTFKKKSL